MATMRRSSALAHPRRTCMHHSTHLRATPTNIAEFVHLTRPHVATHVTTRTLHLTPYTHHVHRTPHTAHCTRYECLACQCNSKGTKKYSNGVYNCDQKEEGTYTCKCKDGYTNDNRGDCQESKSSGATCESSVMTELLGRSFVVTVVVS
jgi:hypothetical protein